ncbi:hypothetical protein ABIE50_006342 [Chitinophaga sp. OAE865]
MLVSTNIGKQISKPKKGEFLYNFFRETGKRRNYFKGDPKQVDPNIGFPACWQGPGN